MNLYGLQCGSCFGAPGSGKVHAAKKALRENRMANSFHRRLVQGEIKIFAGGLKPERKTKVIPIIKSAKPNIFTSIFFKSTFYF